MTLRGKGLALAVIHVLMVSSLGAKLLLDRNTRPRAWARTAPFDPSLPIRGRYVSLALRLDSVDGVAPAVVDPSRNGETFETIPLNLDSVNGELVGRRNATPDSYAEECGEASARLVPGKDAHYRLTCPVLFFIPEHVEDPSVRQPGEELWVEVTLPRKGPPRPVRLGVKRATGPIEPLGLN